MAHQTYLDIDKLNKCKTQALHGVLVLDEDDPLHSFGALFARSTRREHCLVDCLRSREGVELSEEQDRGLGVANVSCPVIRVRSCLRPVRR